MRTSYPNRSIEDYLDDFAGRQYDPAGNPDAEYDPSKPIKIAEENRDYVWTDEMAKEFIQSIFAGFPIPGIVIVDNEIMDGGNRSTVLMNWRNNKFTVKYKEWEGNYDAMTPALSARWNRCMIPVTEITGASRAERSLIYDNYNKGVVLTPGQKLWNRKYLPLVRKATAILSRGGDFPFLPLLQRVWKRTWRKTKTLGELSLAYSIIVASIFGPEHFHTKVHVHLPRMLSTAEEEINLSNLQFICEVLDRVDPTNTFAPKRKEQIFKKFIGGMLHDIHTMSRDDFEEKWSTFCLQAYTTLTKEQIKNLIDVGSARANNQSRIAQLSQNVADFIDGIVHEAPAEEDIFYDSDDTEED
jgi:hypothetical protein